MTETDQYWYYDETVGSYRFLDHDLLDIDSVEYFNTLLIERYVATLFYYSTSSPNSYENRDRNVYNIANPYHESWNHMKGFLNETASICYWNYLPSSYLITNETFYDSDMFNNFHTEGITCNTKRSNPSQNQVIPHLVIGIFFCKFPLTTPSFFVRSVTVPD